MEGGTCVADPVLEGGVKDTLDHFENLLLIHPSCPFSSPVTYHFSQISVRTVRISLYFKREGKMSEIGVRLTPIRVMEDRTDAPTWESANCLQHRRI